MGFPCVPQPYLRGSEMSDDLTLWTYDTIPRRFAKIPITVVAQEAEYCDAAVDRIRTNMWKDPRTARWPQCGVAS